MTAAVEHLLSAIDALSEADRRELVLEILRRSSAQSGDLSEEELTTLAAERFVELDQEEGDG